MSSGWQMLSGLNNNQTLQIASDGSLLAGFGASGLCDWTTTTGTWQQLSGLNNQALAAATDGSIMADFGLAGLWRWSLNGNWQLLTSLGRRLAPQQTKLPRMLRGLDSAPPGYPSRSGVPVWPSPDRDRVGTPKW